MSEASKPVTACLIIIGNEILSGRTIDANLPHIAKVLGQVGIRLAEARVVADDEAAIVDAVNTCRARHTYVFTTGGIGPTHDDITAACIAKAFGRPFGRNPEAERRLLAFYPPERVNEARMSMADMPEGVELIDNPVSVAPGFRIENVYVLAGVPKIMQAMLDLVLPKLEGGVKIAGARRDGLCARGRRRGRPRQDPGGFPEARDRQLSVLPALGPGLHDRVPRHRSGGDRPGGQKPCYALAAGLGATIREVDAG